MMNIGINPFQLGPPSRIGVVEAYHIIPETRSQVLRKLGIDPSFIAVDLFASDQNSTASLYIDKDADAFSFDWSKLATPQQPILWANPPFSKIKQVIAKACVEPCKLVLCTPEWRNRPWWKILDSITV